MGVTNQGAYTNIHVGPKVQSKEEPLLGHGKVEDKGNGLSLRVALRVTPWNMKSTKTEKDNGKNRNI